MIEVRSMIAERTYLVMYVCMYLKIISSPLIKYLDNNPNHPPPRTACKIPWKYIAWD